MLLQYRRQHDKYTVTNFQYCVSSCICVSRKYRLLTMKIVIYKHSKFFFIKLKCVYWFRHNYTFKLALQAQLTSNHPLHTLFHGAQFLGTQRLHSRCPSAATLRLW